MNPLLICPICYKACITRDRSGGGGESDTDNDSQKDTDNLVVLSQFKNILQRYYLTATATANFLDLLLTFRSKVELCQDCMTVVKTICSLYHEIKYKELQLECKIQTFRDIIRLADKVKPRKQLLKKTLSEPVYEGGPTDGNNTKELKHLYRRLKNVRKDFIKKYSRHISRSFPRVTLKRIPQEDTTQAARNSETVATSQTSTAIQQLNVYQEMLCGLIGWGLSLSAVIMLGTLCLIPVAQSFYPDEGRSFPVDDEKLKVPNSSTNKDFCTIDEPSRTEVGAYPCRSTGSPSSGETTDYVMFANDYDDSASFISCSGAHSDERDEEFHEDFVVDKHDNEKVTNGNSCWFKEEENIGMLRPTVPVPDDDIITNHIIKLENDPNNEEPELLISSVYSISPQEYDGTLQSAQKRYSFRTRTQTLKFSNDNDNGCMDESAYYGSSSISCDDDNVDSDDYDVKSCSNSNDDDDDLCYQGKDKRQDDQDGSSVNLLHCSICHKVFNTEARLRTHFTQKCGLSDSLDFIKADGNDGDPGTFLCRYSSTKCSAVSVVKNDRKKEQKRKTESRFQEKNSKEFAVIVAKQISLQKKHNELKKENETISNELRTVKGLLLNAIQAKRQRKLALSSTPFAYSWMTNSSIVQTPMSVSYHK